MTDHQAEKEARYIAHMNGKPLPNRRERRHAARELARALNRTRKAPQ